MNKKDLEELKNLINNLMDFSIKHSNTLNKDSAPLWTYAKEKYNITLDAVLINDIFQFLSFLGLSDNDISDDELNFINYIFGLNYTKDDLINHLNTNLSNDFSSSLPDSFIFFYEFDKYVGDKGIVSQKEIVESLYEIFNGIGLAFMKINDYGELEKASFDSYMNHLRKNLDDLKKFNYKFILLAFNSDLVGTIADEEDNDISHSGFAFDKEDFDISKIDPSSPDELLNKLNNLFRENSHIDLGDIYSDDVEFYPSFGPINRDDSKIIGGGQDNSQDGEIIDIDANGEVIDIDVSQDESDKNFDKSKDLKNGVDSEKPNVDKSKDLNKSNYLDDVEEIKSKAESILDKFDDAEDESDKEEESLEDILEKLNKLVGLETVKNDVNSLINLIQIRKIREERGIKQPDMSLHLVFSGNPGTGKTTVARLLSEIYCKLGLLSKGHLVETDRSGLVAGYVGQTAIKTQGLIEEAMGGILFIDEAYSLSASKGENDFGEEAIDTILKAMEDHRDDFIVIVAGYPKLMDEFLSSNPGLESRFNKLLYFDDYNPQELFDIFISMSDESSLKLDEKAEKFLKGHFEDVYNCRGDNFANGRYVRNIFEKALSNQANRLVNIEDISDDDLNTFIIDDFDDCI